MARFWFGQGLTDWTMTTGDEVVDGSTSSRPVSVTGPVTVTFWDSAVGGTQYTDLLDADGVAMSTITAASEADTLPLGTIPRFQGPDGATALWADAGGGARYLMTPTGLGALVAALQLQTENTDNLVASLQALAAAAPVTVTYDEGSEAWPERPAIAGTRLVYWHGPNGSPPPAGYMATNDLFFGWTA